MHEIRTKCLCAYHSGSVGLTGVLFILCMQLFGRTNTWKYHVIVCIGVIAGQHSALSSLIISRVFVL